MSGGEPGERERERERGGERERGREREREAGKERDLLFFSSDKLSLWYSSTSSSVSVCEGSVELVMTGTSEDRPMGSWLFGKFW